MLPPAFITASTSERAAATAEPASWPGAIRQVPQGQRLQHFEPFPKRWYAPGTPIRGVEPPEYDEVNNTAHPLNPYRQNVLKGDFPIIGEDVFVEMTVTDRALYEYRKVPTPTGITGPGPVRPDFFGDGKQEFLLNDLAVTFDVFKGQQAFKPVDWRVKITPVFNYTRLHVQETGAVNIDPKRGTMRSVADLALQEAFAEIHLLDLSDRYDFLSVEAGILPFRSDFRGFVFDDVNLGVRLLGNADDNKWQYNLAFFKMLDKDTNSLLNKFDDRRQEVIIANVYRQDWPVLGYTSQLSAHFNHDHRGFHFDDNGFLVSPAPVGLAARNKTNALYLGWAGEGHFGRVNITHAFYQVLGSDSLNAFAARQVDINARLLAAELSYDFDWLRLAAFGLFASGDEDARDNKAEGFDGIMEAPNFAGGELSFFNRQAIGLPGGVKLTNVLSPYVDLQTSKFEGHSNFVNPGLLQIGGAVTAELTPKWRAIGGANYLRFVEPGPLETFLELPSIDRNIGSEAFVGTQYRPLLTNNVILALGASAFLPGDGFERIYQSDHMLFYSFAQVLLSW